MVESNRGATEDSGRELVPSPGSAHNHLPRTGPAAAASGLLPPPAAMGLLVMPPPSALGAPVSEVAEPPPPPPAGGGGPLDRPKSDLEFSSSVVGFVIHEGASASLSTLSAQGHHGQKRLHMPHLEWSSSRLQHLQQPQQKRSTMVPATTTKLPTAIKIMVSCTGTVERGGQAQLRLG